MQETLQVSISPPSPTSLSDLADIMDMYIDAYISHIPLESLSSQSSHTQAQAWPYMLPEALSSFYIRDIRKGGTP